MPPSFLVRKVFKGLFRLDRALLPRPPPTSHLARLAARQSSPADKIRVWWWNKTPMQRNSAVVDIPLTFAFVLLLGIEAKNVWTNFRGRDEKCDQRAHEDAMEIEMGK
ncbi:hypothetical protein BTUL_0174g00090 [Botrytis tulipae]|uniref:Uncharacterized protein n=1 Tax=Botrytis tulipae TaxID=87230 RepID=A0A4Z1EAJ4_9HELO|nr:hypothetical protein BTUL_0174g00090 [Botrytis tulipae]